MKYLGRFVAFEGIDRAGKSSVVKVLPALLTGCSVPIRICAEYNSPVGPLISGDALKKLSAFKKAYLFAADRAWTYESECLPALERGELVLWDRYKDSAIAYRAAELHSRPSNLFDLEFVKAINQPFLAPDKTFFIEISVEVSEERARKSNTKEPYDSAFLERVRLEYHKLASAPGYAIVDGARSTEAVAEQIAKEIRTGFPQFFK